FSSLTRYMRSGSTSVTSPSTSTPSSLATATSVLNIKNEPAVLVCGKRAPRAARRRGPLGPHGDAPSHTLLPLSGSSHPSHPASHAPAERQPSSRLFAILTAPSPPRTMGDG